MGKYLKAFVQIFINYHIYSIPILIFEIFFYIKYPNKYNKFKHSNSKFLSDPIPCPFYFLKKIEKSNSIKKYLRVLDKIEISIFVVKNKILSYWCPVRIRTADLLITNQ